MSQNKPITLKQVKENLQNFLNTGNNEAARGYIQTLEKLGVRISYTEVSEEERTKEMKNRVKEILRSKGVSNTDSTNLINSMPIRTEEQNDENRYAERLHRCYESKQSRN